jgi:hypothetical protein
VDAIAALRVWAYETTFPNVRDDAGDLRVFRIEPLPAADWIIATMQAGHMSYLPGMLDDDARIALMDALEYGDITLAELEDANRDALEQISGWRWWSAAKLIATLCNSWQTMGGLLTLSGVNPREESLGAVLAALYARAWIDGDKKSRAKLAQDVATPPASMLTEEAWDEEAATAAVLAFMQEGGTGIPG